MGEKKKCGKTRALHVKSLFTGQILLLQCVQMAYIATKASEIVRPEKIPISGKMEKSYFW